jgi:hypothetical protein
MPDNSKADYFLDNFEKNILEYYKAKNNLPNQTNTLRASELNIEAYLDQYGERLMQGVSYA